MNCLPGWVSTQLTKIDERIAAVNTRVNNIGVYQGATENESGVVGLVPAALSAEKDCFLCGDGTWDAIAGMTNAQIDTAMANVGYVGDIDPSLLTSITNSEIDALFA